MTKAMGAMLWPQEHNYARFKEICTDQIHDTFEEFRLASETKLGQLEKRGIVFERIQFDPEDLVRFAEAQGGEIDSEMRATFAAILAAQDHRPN